MSTYLSAYHNVHNMYMTTCPRVTLNFSNLDHNATVFNKYMMHV